MRRCPNCGHEVPEQSALCPNCGADVPAVWPPPPEGREPPEPARGDPALQRREVNDGAAFGCGVQILLCVLIIIVVLSSLESKWMVAIGKMIPSQLQGAALQGSFYLPAVAIMFAMYLNLRPKKPYYARGVGYSVIAGLAISLGLMAICGR